MKRKGPPLPLVKKPLKGVVACLSGIDHEEKEKLHSLVVSLGGRYSRELNPDRVTHLIVLKPSGLKHETAIQHPDRISIVSPSWVSACVEEQARVDEGEFMFSSDVGKKLKGLLDKEGVDSQIFSRCFFHLIGWEVSDRDFRSITLLIRRCWGTILWEGSDEAITHVVAKDGALEQSARREIGKRENVYVISPLWVVASCASGSMAETIRYPAIDKSVVAKQEAKSEASKIGTESL